MTRDRELLPHDKKRGLCDDEGQTSRRSHDDSKRYRRGYDVDDGGADRLLHVGFTKPPCDDWECVECLMWNYPEDNQCHRCGTYHPSERDDRYPNHGIDSGVDYEEEEEVDEFGRIRKKQSEKKKMPPEWPPCFDSTGSAFVFDSRSGMFYEGESDFFYDPKSKLYYGNKKGAYYKYNNDSSPPFEPVQNVDSQQAGSSKTNTMDQVPILDPSHPEHGVEGSKKMITINLKTKSLKSGKSKQQDPPAAAALAATHPRVQKQHALNIGKWSDRQVEKRIQDRIFQRTAKGEPLCPLCRRKFASVEKLLHHERVSQLHQENLAKADKIMKEDPQYIDRAEHRRTMYGLEAPAVPSVEVQSEKVTNSSQAPLTATAQSLESDTNIGNQLLRKMGWKDGKALGSRPESSSVATELVKDWERIEKLAGQGGIASRNEGVGALK